MEILDIRTKDQGQYRINTQPEDSNFMPGETIVSKVEPVRNQHEADLYRKNGWLIEEDWATGESIAHRAFAVLRDGGIHVFRQRRNEEQPRIAEQIAALSGEEALENAELSSVLRWQHHGAIVERWLREYGG